MVMAVARKRPAEEPREPTIPEEEVFQLLTKRRFSPKHVIRVTSPGDSGQLYTEVLYVHESGTPMTALIEYPDPTTPHRTPLIQVSEGW